MSERADPASLGIKPEPTRHSDGLRDALLRARWQWACDHVGGTASADDGVDYMARAVRAWLDAGPLRMPPDPTSGGPGHVVSHERYGIIAERRRLAGLEDANAL